MRKCINFPGRYVQGDGIMGELGINIVRYGKKPLIVWGARTKNATSKAVLKSFALVEMDYAEFQFAGECTKEAAKEIADAIVANGCDMVLGIGGGKVIDCVKASAFYSSVRCIIVPTIASNDAPTGGCTIWYDKDGNWLGADSWPTSPDMIIVDTRVVAQAPVRYFLAGMCDALATYPEARAAFAAHSVVTAGQPDKRLNLVDENGCKISIEGGRQTMTAMVMAKLCYDTLLEYGPEAVEAVKAKVVTPALERVVEANILLSGIGWESGGLATAHSVANSLATVPEVHSCLHGEKVSFGIMVQLCMDEGVSDEEKMLLSDYLVNFGMPVTLADLNMDKIPEDRMWELVDTIASAKNFTANHNFPVTRQMLYDAIMAADDLGKRRKALRASITKA